MSKNLEDSKIDIEYTIEIDLLNIKNTYGFIIIDKYGIYRNKQPSNRWLLLCSYEMQQKSFLQGLFARADAFQSETKYKRRERACPARTTKKRKF